MKWMNKLQKFMIGRYGVDELYKFLFTIYIISFIINLFIKSLIIEIIGLVIVIYTFYRVLSKNISKRYKENQIYLKVKKQLLYPRRKTKSKIKDRNHIYKKCHKCKKILKLPLPNKRGIKHVKCPNCKKKIKLLVLGKEKIEVIKNKRNY